MNRDLRAALESRKLHFASSSELAAAFHKSRDRLVAEIQQECPEAKIHEIGPDKSNSSGWWSCVIEVGKDATRDLLRRDDQLKQRMLREAQVGGFPPYSVEFESRETVDRDYQGSWFFRLR